MAVKIGHASLSEKGTINGAKGDSTGGEVCIRNWYSKPWDFMAIHPDATVREKHAKAVEDCCENDNIGYGQNDRNTGHDEAKKVSYIISNIKTKCNLDCSSMQNLCALVSGASGVTYGSNGWTTSDMKDELKTAGYIIITDNDYLTSADYCVRGAIYVKAGSHTVCGLTNGAKASQTLSKAGITSSSASSSSLKVGDVVEFTGTKHYVSSYSGAKYSTCKKGKAKITAISKGKSHPYHLVAISGGGSSVHGWVDESDINEAKDTEIKVGDTVTYSGSVHYTSCYAGAIGKSCKGGTAEVTEIRKGKAHPYHLKHTGKGCTVYGWVDADKVSK